MLLVPPQGFAVGPFDASALEDGRGKLHREAHGVAFCAAEGNMLKFPCHA